jgi:hypothetical protein
MLRLILLALLVFGVLLGSSREVAAASDQAAERACVRQVTAESTQIDTYRPMGRIVVSPAVHEPDFGEGQSRAAENCDFDLYAKRYSI